MELEGKQFGWLKVMALAHINTNAEKFWLCKCACGKEIELKGWFLTTGRKSDCGCRNNIKQSAAAVRMKMPSVHRWREF